MTHRQALREIEKLGYTVIAQTSFEDGVKYEASNGLRLAKGEKCSIPDDAMASCFRAVLAKELG